MPTWEVECKAPSLTSAWCNNVVSEMPVFMYWTSFVLHAHERPVASPQDALRQSGFPVTSTLRVPDP